MNRREALKKIYSVIIAVGASSFFTFEDLMAMEDKTAQTNKPNLIWLQASSCSGCTLSLTNIEDVSFMDFILKFVNIIYHPNISLATGDDVINLLNKATIDYNNNYLLVCEGSIPTKLPHACLMADIPIIEWIDKMSSSAKACISVGTCASFGGITTINVAQTGASSLIQVLKERNIDKPTIALPNCPMKPEHFVYTLLYFIKFNKFPPADARSRPKIFFSKTIHQSCVHYYEFQENIFATKINEKGCLLELGCQGPVTKSDCMVNGHNANTNNCIKAGHPCVGCASEHFPRQIMFRQFNDQRVITPLKEVYFDKQK